MAATTASRREHVRPSVPVELKRTGPDLARVGGKYSDAWQVAHLINRAPWCRNRSCRAIPSPRPLKFDVKEHLKTLKIVGVPYTDEQIENAAKDLSRPVPTAIPLAFLSATPRLSSRASMATSRS